MIKVSDLHFAYENSDGPVLKGITLEIPEGAHVAIIGPTGCGKTSLVKHLNGLLLPSEGEVLVDGMDTRLVGDMKAIRQKVAMVFQNPDDQFVGMTVEEDVAFGPGNMGLPTLEIRERVDRSLDTVGMLDYAKRAPHSLSSGEKQLVAIAGALALEPKYLILDEPTTYLDPLWSKKIMEVVFLLRDRGMSIIHVTHRMEEAAQAHQVLVLNRGTVATTGEPSQVFARRQLLEEIGLDVPLVSKLMWQLKEMGLKVNPHVYSLDGAAEELRSLFVNSMGIGAQDARRDPGARSQEG